MPEPKAKKNLWHSELAKMGPVSVTYKQKPTVSVKDKKTIYVTLVIDGQTRYYKPENEACEKFFATRKVGETFSIVAEGRDEDAAITYVGVTGATKTATKEPPPIKTEPEVIEPAPEAGAKKGADPVTAAKKHIAHNETLIKIALIRAHIMRIEHDAFFGKDTMTDAMQVAVFNSMLFGASQAGVVRELPFAQSFDSLHQKKK